MGIGTPSPALGRRPHGCPARARQIGAPPPQARICSAPLWGAARPTLTTAFAVEMVGVGKRSADRPFRVVGCRPCSVAKHSTSFRMFCNTARGRQPPTLLCVKLAGADLPCRCLCRPCSVAKHYTAFRMFGNTARGRQRHRHCVGFLSIV